MKIEGLSKIEQETREAVQRSLGARGKRAPRVGFQLFKKLGHENFTQATLTW